ncbi:aldehyde dehydrogenase family protein [Aquibacillus salsiterrae]|uniref:Aldehyde dehydrogenase family protein n=1 Tax=Aquibacillus salsiterrae TaxID=2950439 RepID=A0A9X3WDE8_9BACI|nr:aldehyde dehydrogenase family protein [Aquibacillus salsiterrae]MDC3417582.1 aldehyde dehydrogenase family protein [Aquibacillus salsiterrae]
MITSTNMLGWLERNQPKTYGNFINGKWIASKSQQTYPIYHAANKREVLASFQQSTEDDVDAAVWAANEAFQSWSQVPGPDRGAILYRFAELLEQNVEELAYMLSAEQGKLLAESRGEVLRAAKETRFCAGEAFRIEGQTLPAERTGVWNSTVRKPIGVIAAIAPWNFPVVTPVRKIIPALAYGCTVVYKPASITPWTSARLMELLAEAGVPSGAVNLIVGSGSKIGHSLINHPDIKGISFTGSTKIGKNINETAAKRLVKTQLELGGKNPAVVLDFDDAKVVAKQIVAAAFACSGQRCTAISRIVVVQEKKQQLVDALLEEVKNIRVGPAWEENANMGPLVNKPQLDIVQHYVNVGQQEGAKLLFGGDVLTEGVYADGHYMVPALFDEVEPQMQIAKEEIFGPVLTITTVGSMEEALAVANDVDYGLAASVFTKDLHSAYAFAERLQSGMVHINHGTASAAHLPFGGTKQSGFGAFSIGQTNAEFFTELKAVYFQY